jgi:hypothetical protein
MNYGLHAAPWKPVYLKLPVICSHRPRLWRRFLSLSHIRQIHPWYHTGSAFLSLSANIISKDLLKIRPMFRIKCKVFPVYSTKAYRGSKGIAPFILNPSFRRRRVVSITFQPLYPREELRHQFNRKLGESENRPGCSG